jgi:hypothetical protein
MPHGIMQPHIRAIVAASAHAFIIRKKVAGLYDHAADRHLRIAAETRGDRLQGVDGDRSIMFGGTLPDIYDEGEKAFLSLAIDGATARGYDRASAGFYEAQVSERTVQIYDHSEKRWFAFDIQVA